MKSKFYRWMKQLFVLGAVLLGCMAPLSVKADVTEKPIEIYEHNGFKHNDYYLMSEKEYLKNGSKWELVNSYKYSYDKQGNLLKKIWTGETDYGPYSYETSYEYQYDKRGNVLSKKTLDKGCYSASNHQKVYYGKQLNGLDTYTYDKKGNVKTHKAYSYIEQYSTQYSGKKRLIYSTKYTYKNGKLYKETLKASKDYGSYVSEIIYRPDGTLKSYIQKSASGSEQYKHTYDKYGNIIKSTDSVESRVVTYKNTYQKGVLSCSASINKYPNSTRKSGLTTTYYTSGYRKGWAKKSIYYYDINYTNKDTNTHKYKADKTGKNVGEVISYTNGTANHKTCYTWKKMK